MMVLVDRGLSKEGSLGEETDGSALDGCSVR